MSFSTDRDLLVYEPNAFEDLFIIAQQRVSVSDAQVSGTTASSPTADFAAAGVETGAVVMIGSIAHEVLGRTDAHTLEVSLPRARRSGAAIRGPAQAQGTALALAVRTFAPQAALVHDALLAVLGLANDAQAQAAWPDPDQLTEDDIVSLSVMTRLEALGTLERIYSGAVSVTGDQALLTQADHYRKRFHEALHRATILVDTDHDGYGDHRLAPGVKRLTRA